MCKCTLNMRTPWCGKPGCEMPPQIKKEISIQPTIESVNKLEELINDIRANPSTDSVHIHEHVRSMISRLIPSNGPRDWVGRFENEFIIVVPEENGWCIWKKKANNPDNVLRFIENEIAFACSEERKRCVEIVRKFQITDWSHNQLEKLADSINTNNK